MESANSPRGQVAGSDVLEIAIVAQGVGWYLLLTPSDTDRVGFGIGAGMVDADICLGYVDASGNVTMCNIEFSVKFHRNF